MGLKAKQATYVSEYSDKKSDQFANFTQEFCKTVSHFNFYLSC